jgi:large subunit ribosomal protein L23
MSKLTLVIPKLSEKSYGQSQNRVYTVLVDTATNKQTVIRAIEAQFNVEVKSVNIANIAGKAKRTISKNGRRTANGRDIDTKKAYVTLKEGFSLPFFEAIEEEQKQSDKIQDELAKKAEKESAKQDKPKSRRLGRIKSVTPADQDKKEKKAA